MSQKNSTLNFLIHDANGQPQMVKVVKNTSNQPIGHIKLKPNPVKIIKIPTTGEGSTQAPVFQALKLTGLNSSSKLVQVPVDFETLSHLQVTPKTEPPEPADEQEVEEFKLETLPEVAPSEATLQPVVVTTNRSKTQQTATMSHATRRRHDSDNEQPAEYVKVRRVSGRQLELLWEFLNSHRDIAVAYNRSMQAKEYSRAKWIEARDLLNSQEEGTHKDWKGWCKYWVDLKAKLKKRVAAVRSSRTKTDGGSSTEPPLTEIEDKFLRILGEDFCQGLPDVRVDSFLQPSGSTTAAVDDDLSILKQVQQVKPTHPEIQPPTIEPATPPLPSQPAVTAAAAGVAAIGVEATGTAAAGAARSSRWRRRRWEPYIMTQEAARRALVESSQQTANAAVRSAKALEIIGRGIMDMQKTFRRLESTTKRRRHADKVGKGLRHFSMKVCEKVRSKGFTSYNEVADELVLEFATGMHGSGDSQQYDQKNIRRRVYDALNVLMAMNIISKEKKEIRWLGLPTNSVQECTSLEKEKAAKLEQIQKKTQQLQELILQHISFKSLIERNKEAESRGVKPSASSAIHLPFIVVNTSDKALIDCSISNDKTEYMFNFNKRFQIHDDIDILKRMGLLFGLDKGECSEEDIERAKRMVPKSLESYVDQMARGNISNISSILEEVDNTEEAEETLEGEGEPEAADDADEEQEVEAQDYSDNSSDVDV